MIFIERNFYLLIILMCYKTLSIVQLIFLVYKQIKQRGGKERKENK